MATLGDQRGYIRATLAAQASPNCAGLVQFQSRRAAPVATVASARRPGRPLGLL